MGSKFMFIVVENTGLCTWKPYQILESTCQADMTNYPYDTQNCDLMFSTWSSTTAQVQTIIGTSGMQRHENFVENSEWKLEGISQRNETINGQLTAVFTLTLKRNHAFVVFYVTVPVILLSLLNALTFALPVSAGEKSGFAITVFLSFVIYVIVTFQKMPDSSDTISLFAVYLLIMTGLSNLTVIISVLEIRMIELKTNNKPLPQCTISFTKWILNSQHNMLCIKDGTDTSQNKANKVKPENDDDSDVEEDTAWPEFVSALDFTCFWVFFLVTVLLAVCYMSYIATQ
ncbi:neuronal acetylcholine receptor subunit beta-3-like [Ruditapes philippinarum]|uniref:neuronal acetylcholine receptor subunit beta-3-like n=1 Tax=Ruditapes philippinarum TaxID=129788 RepID=UPI00295B5065|nr:neuronal acetylcholine receptor subunit beta-3-like [Ruditapes philippinarum]